MDWQLPLIIVLGSALLLMITGMPIAFCFLAVNVVGMYVYLGGEAGLRQIVLSSYSSVASFDLLPVPLFILMGEVMFRSGIGPKMMDALDKWLGGLPGRLSLLAVGGGTLFASLTGSTMASVSMLGSVLVPEMQKRGYKKSMILGPILGSGGLAMLIPPSALAVILGAVAEISIGKILIGIIIPGLLMAVLYAVYIISRCWLQPELAPVYTVSPPPLAEKLVSFVRYVLPLGFVIFLVLGLILLGVATPSEAAAAGAIGCFVLAFFYRALNWKLVKESVGSTIEITAMLLMVLLGATAFSQILAASGSSRGLVEYMVSLPLSPIMIFVVMQIVMLILGTFMAQIAIMMICLPIFMPIVHVLGFDPVWFAVVTMINMEVAGISPPFGLTLYAMKAVTPKDVTMGDCFKASLPFCGLGAVGMVIITAFPALALWLPSTMH